MELSPRLMNLYDRKESFSEASISALKELAAVNPLRGDDIPETLTDKLHFSNDHFVTIAACMSVFEQVATESARIQENIQDLARYSSFLDTIVPYRIHKVNGDVAAKRDRLNSLRNLFTESLLNDDMITARTVAAANGTFPELDNFRTFLQPFGEYVASLNMGTEVEDEAITGYLSVMDQVSPGALLSLVIGSEQLDVVNQQADLIMALRNHRDKFSRVDTERNTLCWSLSRSFIDLPIRLLARAGYEPGSELSVLQAQVAVLTEMQFDDFAEGGINYLVEWTAIIHNSLLLIVDLSRFYRDVMSATYDCLWEFFFYQLSELEQLEETEVLESVMVMCQQTLFKE
ncbi:hypothetical protein NRE35_004350 [Salmonella enterica]|nr:hypothetical protein [Escherichia coli]EJO2543984.1 hypothetical protein [Salmonella enterica]ELF5187205.1 hypothetical protein [Salmonella enterica]